MDFLPKDLEDIILDYKKDLDHLVKIQEIKNSSLVCEECYKNFGHNNYSYRAHLEKHERNKKEKQRKEKEKQRKEKEKQRKEKEKKDKRDKKEKEKKDKRDKREKEEKEAIEVKDKKEKEEKDKVLNDLLKTKFFNNDIIYIALDACKSYRFSEIQKYWKTHIIRDGRKYYYIRDEEKRYIVTSRYSKYLKKLNEEVEEVEEINEELTEEEQSSF